MPKAELHVHLEGTLQPAFALELAAREGRDVSAFLRDGAYRTGDFTQFLAVYDGAAVLLRREEDFERLAFDYLVSIAGMGALYAELLVSPDHGVASGLSAAAYLRAAARGMARAERRCGIVSRQIVVGVRHFGPEAVERAARIAVDPAFPFVTGFNLAGDERQGRAADFARAFDIAREAGLGLTAHAGELCGPASVRGTLDALKPERLGHGVRAAEDPDLVARLRGEGIVLEVCPGSNLALGICPDLASHPLKALVEAGVKATLASDDPPFFATDLATEYERAESLLPGRGLTFTRTAIEAAFVDEPTRRRLLDAMLARAMALGAPPAAG
ncbi:adenosine deaminase [Aurantimonas sp. Leaf443]|nr:adenosine deaminase [Aurantimonas sp. Leaf443]